MPRKLNREEIVDYKEVFKLFDVDGSGAISKTEMHDVLKRFGYDISEQSVQKLIKDGLKKAGNRDGKIDFEFCLDIMNNAPDGMVTDGDGEVELKLAFDSIDRDKSGTINFNEIENLMRQCGLSISEEEINIVMKMFDSNKDGILDFEEFQELLNYAPGPPDLTLEKGKTMKDLANITLLKNRGEKRTCRVSPTVRFYLITLGVPLFFSILYSVAILFPPEARVKAPTILWTDGLLVKDDKGVFQICPRISICSVGIAQIVSIAIARLTAFSSYVTLALVFVTKMHSAHNFLSSTLMREFVPFEDMHHFHSTIGVAYGILALMHTIAHLVRWGLRGELLFLVTSRAGLSGVLGMITMTIVVLSMTFAKKFKISFESRFSCHWLFTFFVLCICFHTPRCRNITCIFFFLWVTDYLYTYFFKTHSLDIVEFTPLPSRSGTQMLWRNPKGFHVKSGQYVKVRIPWLSEGGSEWHPFSIYLKEKTDIGRQFMNPQRMEEGVESWDDNPGIVTEGETEYIFIREFLKKEYKAGHDNVSSGEYTNVHAREDQDRYKTTQVFIAPVGNWSRRLNEEVSEGANLSSCWVRGPFTSPFSVGNSFSHLVLTATGIGITPSLAIAAQFPGHTRTKILIWSCKDANMLKFFAPLFEDFHMIMVYYTGREMISYEESMRIKGSKGNVFLQMKRGDMTNAISTVVTSYENSMQDTPFSKMEMIPTDTLSSWCVMYCGGSKRLCGDLSSFCQNASVEFHSELFDW